jgi:APA family basic amino acid/polyamine antiporter
MVNMLKTQRQSSIRLGACITFAVGSMVGAGVFVLSSVAIQNAGPAALISFGLAGVAVLCSATSFMVIAARTRPGELGYAPVGQALGSEFWSFLTAWAFYVSSVVCTAFVLSAFGAYFHDFFLPSVPTLFLALLAAGIMTLINLGPASKISRIEGALVGIKVGILLLLIIAGLGHLQMQDFQPFLPHGVNSALTTSGLLFIAYLGFSVITNIAGDVKNPQKTVPRAILLSIIIVILLYGGVVLALLAVPLANYNEASIGNVATVLMGPVGGVLVSLAALVSTLSAANSNILGSSEIMVRLAKRKDVPTIMGKLRHGHPMVSVLSGAAVYLLLIASGQTDIIISLANVAAIVAIVFVNVAAIRLLRQKTSGNIRLIGEKILPIIGLLGAVGQLFLLGWTSLAGIAFVALGSLLYVVRRRFHHKEDHKKMLRHLAMHGGPVTRVLHTEE